MWIKPPSGRDGRATLLHAGKGDDHTRQQPQREADRDHTGDLADDLARPGVVGVVIDVQGGVSPCDVQS